MAYIDKLIGKFNKAQSAVNSIKGVAAKLQSVNYNTALDELGEQKSEILEKIKARRSALETSLNAKNRAKGDLLKQTPNGTPTELVYPLHDDLQNYVVFDIRGRRNQSASGGEAQFHDAPKSIALYVPDALVSQANVEYEKASIGQLGRAFMNVKKAIDSPQNDLAKAIGDNADQLIGGMISGMMNSATGGLSNLAAGKAVNPLEEQTLSGIPFRSFSFGFEFYPRSEQEAQIVNEIIHSFRRAMLPDTFGGGIKEAFGGKSNSTLETANLTPNFFNYPNIFDVYYDGPIAGKVDGFLPAVLTSCEVDHTGGEKFATYYDGQIVKTTMNLQFQEIRILTQENYDKISALKLENGKLVPRSNQERAEALRDGGNSLLDSFNSSQRGGG